MSASATTRFLRAIAAAWRPRPRQTTPEWIVENCRMPPDFGAPVPYSLDDFPFWREVLACCDDPEVYEIVLMTGTQIGKTETVRAMLQAQAEIDPGPMMLVGPDRDYIIEQQKKTYKAAEVNRVLRDRLPPESRRNLRWIDFGTAYCYLAWVRTTQRVSGKAVKFVLCSEVDRYKEPLHEGAIIKLITERVKAFVRYKIVYESTPQDETSNIAALYEQSDQRTYHVPCPHCGHYQELRFFTHKDGPYAGRGGVVGIKEGDKWLSADDVLQTAYYLCEKGCRIDNRQKADMVARGVWCPKGQRVTAKGRLTGTPLRGPRRRGYHLSSIYSKSISFGRIAREYLLSRENLRDLANFYNNWLGLKFTPRAKVPLWKELGKLTAAPHARGTLPTAVCFLTAGIDVQTDRVYYVVRGWGEGATSWLIDWGERRQTINPDGSPARNSDLDQLVPLVLSRNFPYVADNPLGQKTLQVFLAGVDTGWEPARVWDWVRQFPGDRVRAVAGDTQMTDPFYRMSIVEKNARTGVAYSGGMRRWAINRNTYNSDLQQRWKMTAGEPGYWYTHADPIKTAETYLRQVVNEGPISKQNTQKRTVISWQVIDEKVGNHYWDCEAYARALADMVTGGNWTGLSPLTNEPPKRPPSRSTFTTPDGRPYLVTER